MVLVTLATWTVRGFRVIPQISGAGWGTVKGNTQRFWLQIATEITEKSFSDKKLRQKTAWNSGLVALRSFVQEGQGIESPGAGCAASAPAAAGSEGIEDHGAAPSSEPKRG